MTIRLQYGTPAKIFHWLIVALLALQYPIGWFMPDIHPGMSPGAGMTFHLSIGMIILALTADAANVARVAFRADQPRSNGGCGIPPNCASSLQ